MTLTLAFYFIVIILISRGVILVIIAFLYRFFFMWHEVESEGFLRQPSQMSGLLVKPEYRHTHGKGTFVYTRIAIFFFYYSPLYISLSLPLISHSYSLCFISLIITRIIPFILYSCSYFPLLFRIIDESSHHFLRFLRITLTFPFIRTYKQEFTSYISQSSGLF